MGRALRRVDQGGKLKMHPAAEKVLSDLADLDARVRHLEAHPLVAPPLPKSHDAAADSALLKSLLDDPRLGPAVREKMAQLEKMEKFA